MVILQRCAAPLTARPPNHPQFYIPVTCLRIDVEVDGEVARLSLLVPSLVPSARAEGSVSEEKLAARSEILALGVDALVVVDVVLPAVLGLVHVRVAGVDTGGDELEGLGLALIVRHFGGFCS
jgi:hypothetical protein